MKIKVVTLKDIVKYLAKIGIVFGVIAIFANFFYGNRNNVNSYFTFNSAKFLDTLKQEILLLRGNNARAEGLPKGNYMANTINSELSMFSIVATTSVNATGLGNNNDDNTEVQDDELVNQETNEVNESSASNLQEDNLQEDNLQEAEVGVDVEVLPSDIPDKTTYEVFGVRIRNESDYNIQTEIKDLDTSFNKNDIVIFHTHTCESYTPTEQYQYSSTGNFRTTDLNYSVSRVGDELEKYLANYGYSVVHDKSYHDYPSYNGSYDRSLITVKNLLATYENTDVVIDLHRDAIGDNTYAPTVRIGDDYCARLMFVIGTDGGGLKHDNWRENVKFAIKVVQKGNELYPGLFKPIIVRNSRYNHHLAKAACIIEVGATGNTLEQCLNSMKYLSKIYNEM